MTGINTAIDSPFPLGITDTPAKADVKKASALAKTTKASNTKGHALASHILAASLAVDISRITGERVDPQVVSARWTAPRKNKIQKATLLEKKGETQQKKNLGL